MMRHKNQSGFTLLELLIAMVIVSMVLTSAFAAIRIGSRSWEAGHQRSDSIEEMRSIAEFARRQMSQSIPTFWEEDDESRIAFVGQRRLVRFIAPAPFDADTVGLLTYSLIVDDQPGESKLRLEYETYDPGATGFGEVPTGNGITFAANFESITFDYYGSVEKDSRDTWYSKWPMTAELLPRLVRIKFGSDSGSAAWPDLVVALHSRPAQ